MGSQLSNLTGMKKQNLGCVCFTNHCSIQLLSYWVCELDQVEDGQRISS